MKTLFLSLAGLAACSLAAIAPAAAATNLVVNGTFSAETINNAASTTSAQLSGYQGYSSGATVTGWTNTSYGFVFTPGAGTSGTTADTTGATINQFGGYNGNANVYLWGPGSGGGGVNNGLTQSPQGSNFIAIDGSFGGSLSQSFTGLTVGFQYTTTFYYAAAEQGGFTGATTSGFTVTFGDGTTTSSYSTPTLSNPSQGFTPWRQATATFIATSANETLSFLATGGPSGSPPMALLDGVTLAAVPEPASLALLGAAVVGAFGVARSRKRKVAGSSTTA